MEMCSSSRMMAWKVPTSWKPLGMFWRIEMGYVPLLEMWCWQYNQDMNVRTIMTSAFHMADTKKRGRVWLGYGVCACGADGQPECVGKDQGGTWVHAWCVTCMAGRQG